jgi:hypothetical protein
MHALGHRDRRVCMLTKEAGKCGVARCAELAKPLVGPCRLCVRLPYRTRPLPAADTGVGPVCGALPAPKRPVSYAACALELLKGAGGCRVWCWRRALPGSPMFARFAGPAPLPRSHRGPAALAG